ncbi:MULTISPECIES: hypothetical protein [Vibrio]|uniref:hypothetical protein n=1 Tax=Vibrio TaxID=662 RepID=UPI002074E2AE|nr:MULTISPECIES: hypothetical protein [Vibrio]USD32897.1 hypothetical protein J8Z27_01950 [Vibrio sp. SCSIO 43186]USD45937.1 hypothetical protein J4N38_01950 [Vibrio sp. SCSIO 43145]USD70022.1 hypothetical protein J4N41_01950 [Vibrio sp. SCSIO 43139]USD94932.1 hypothetical protein CTT30_01990 [Vibrio coralliilyticus]
MIIGFFVTCFFAYTSYIFVIRDTIWGAQDGVPEIKVSYSDGVMIMATFFLFTYIIPFLVLNRHRVKEPLELWEIYRVRTVNIVATIAFSIILLTGFLYKKFEVSYLIEKGYEYSHTKENHRSFGFDTDIYVLAEKH